MAARFDKGTSGWYKSVKDTQERACSAWSAVLSRTARRWPGDPGKENEMRIRRGYGLAALGIAVNLVLSTGLGWAAEELAATSLSSTGIVWRPLISNEGTTLTVAGPGGVVFRGEYGPGRDAAFALRDLENGAPDGQYTYELRLTPVIGTEAREWLDASRDLPDRSSVTRYLRDQGMIPSGPLVQSGHFRVAGGQILVPSETVEPRAPAISGSKAISDIPTKDVVHADDVIITGSLCVGFDCLTDGTENFGFDTIKMKENNIRIFFDDTSTTAGFPANDWRIIANDSSSGGGNYLAIEDSTGAKTPFKIEAGARTNAIHVSSTGRVGLGTATPVLDLHVVRGDTPSLRLDQDTSSGWTAQVWDIAGNESNFFIRDTTGGSRLPFRIQPGAPTNTLTLKSDGLVGLGTWSPGYQLDVRGSDTERSELHFSHDNSDTGGWLTSVLENNFYLSSGAMYDAAAGGWIQKSSDGKSVYAGSGGLGFSIYAQEGGTVGSPVTSALRMRINYQGYVGIGQANPTFPLQMASGARCTVAGLWMSVSSRDAKENITELTSEQALATLKDLTPVTFNYKVEAEERHVGFIAEDVPDLVASADRKGLSSMDIVAVLTKAVQEQQRTIEVQQRDLEEQRRTIADLMGKVGTLLGHISASPGGAP
jgi:hypothetical protein